MKPEQEARWNRAMSLRCPFLRFEHGASKWLAINEEPCPLQRCGETNCHNYGKPFDEPNRLVILKAGGRP